MDTAGVPTTAEEVSALEARYRPLDPAAAWADVVVDAARWQRHAAALRDALRRADSQLWGEVRERFLRAAALESSVLAELVRPAPELSTIVLRSSLSDDGWAAVVDQGRIVVECHRRALVVAADAAEAGRPIDVDLIARLQDLIVESQKTYTVTVESGEQIEVELPRRQYKPVSNYLLRTDYGLVPFAPAGVVAREMEWLVGELASPDFARLHPVVQSAYLHLALIQVHPFADGNGRLARTLACMPLLRETGLPQLILADQWPAYVQALERWNEGDVHGVVELFLAAQVNAMDLARSLLEGDAGDGVAAPPPSEGPEQTLLDMVVVHLRAAIGVPDAGTRVGVSRGDAADVVRVARVDAAGRTQTDIEIGVHAEDVPGWLLLRASTGEVLEVWVDDVHPVPTEIAHLRIRAWLDRLLRSHADGRVRPAQVRGVFVLGVPRSGTTVMGNWIGSHPDVLGLAEYGGFYVAHSVAPAYLNKLPGQAHESYLRAMRDLAGEHVARLAREQGCGWFCDATPWNLQVAGALADSLSDAVFVLMLRHFSGAVLSLRQFHWAGTTWQDAAQLWVTLNQCIEQLPAHRTVVVGYESFAAYPSDTVAAIGEALQELGLDRELFDDRQFTASHAHIVGQPRPTVASLVEGRVVFHPIPSLDETRWTPDVHAAVWPVVKDMHVALAQRFPGVYTAPPRPRHVPENEW